MNAGRAQGQKKWPKLAEKPTWAAHRGSQRHHDDPLAAVTTLLKRLDDV